MYTDAYEQQRDIMESQLCDYIDWEQEQADMATQERDRRAKLKEEADEYQTYATQAEKLLYPRDEINDLRLAQDLRDLADRIEARYK